MTTNGTPHPIPPSPAATPAERPTFTESKRLFIEHRTASGVTEVWEVTDEELVAECARRMLFTDEQCREMLSGDDTGSGTENEKPVVPPGGWAPATVAAFNGPIPETIYEAEAKRIVEEVVGTTPSGEAVGMVEPPVFVQGKPSEKALRCDKKVADCPGNVDGWRCALPDRHAPDRWCDGKKDPVRMVGAERAEVSSLSDRRWSKEAEFFASVGKLPSERATEIAWVRSKRPAGNPSESAVSPSIADVLAMLDERLGRSGT